MGIIDLKEISYMYASSESKCKKCKKGVLIKVSDSGPQSSGYSFGKGVLGAALLGPVGAVAGINGKKTHTVTYKCSNCGEIVTKTYDKNGNIVK